jgi:hypothetical protein
VSWLEETLERNLSWRAEEILNEIHGVKKEDREDVPDTKLNMAELASWVQSGMKPRVWRRAWRVG